jgi:hypothetical protein
MRTNIIWWVGWGAAWWVAFLTIGMPTIELASTHFSQLHAAEVWIFTIGYGFPAALGLASLCWKALSWAFSRMHIRLATRPVSAGRKAFPKILLPF